MADCNRSCTELNSSAEDRIAEAVERRLLPFLEKLERRQGGQVSQEYLSIRQTATYIGMSEKFIRKAVKEGLLPCSNPGSELRSTLRIARKDVDAWIVATRIKHPPSKAARDALVEEVFGRKKKW